MTVTAELRSLPKAGFLGGMRSTTDQSSSLKRNVARAHIILMHSKH
jgi:hypothetical protein